jgi:hypothetical protein
LNHCAKVFVDDLLIHSETFEEHLQHLAAVLSCLIRCGLRVHPKKSSFRYQPGRVPGPHAHHQRA